MLILCVLRMILRGCLTRRFWQKSKAVVPLYVIPPLGCFDCIVHCKHLHKRILQLLTIKIHSPQSLVFWGNTCRVKIDPLTKIYPKLPNPSAVIPTIGGNWPCLGRKKPLLPERFPPIVGMTALGVAKIDAYA